jgi:hypothetical protein
MKLRLDCANYVNYSQDVLRVGASANKDEGK